MKLMSLDITMTQFCETGLWPPHEAAMGSSSTGRHFGIYGDLCNNIGVTWSGPRLTLAALALNQGSTKGTTAWSRKKTGL